MTAVLPVVSREAQALVALLRLGGDGRAVAVSALDGLSPAALADLGRAARRLADLADQALELAHAQAGEGRR